MTSPEQGSAYAAWLGREISDRYRLTRLLGEGGMGAVFVAEHLLLCKEVAFKIIRPEIASDPKIAARFRREAMATAQIDSPHIASAIDFGTLPEGGAFLVTHLARGVSLRQRLAAGPLRWPEAAAIASQLADALATAHALGIIHRDLKPDNIIVGERDDGSPLATILDFGIASLSGDASLPAEVAAPLTSFGMVLGTPGYMAPEQAVGDRIDARIDLYALGVILWEAITGGPLWTGADLIAIVQQQMRSAAPRLRQRGHAIPQALDDLVHDLLARAPRDRPESASAVRGALERLLTAPSAELLAADPAATAPPAAALTAATTAGSLPATQPDPRGPQTAGHTEAPRAENRRLHWLLALCFILGSVLLVGVGRWLLAAESDPDGGEDAASTTSLSDDESPGDTKKSGKGEKKKKKQKEKEKQSADDPPNGDDDYEVVKDKSGRMRMIRRFRR